MSLSLRLPKQQRHYDVVLATRKRLFTWLTQDLYFNSTNLHLLPSVVARFLKYKVYFIVRDPEHVPLFPHLQFRRVAFAVRSKRLVSSILFLCGLTFMELGFPNEQEYDQAWYWKQIWRRLPCDAERLIKQFYGKHENSKSLHVTS